MKVQRISPENPMTLPLLCDGIHLQAGMKASVLDFASRFDFHLVDAYLKDFRLYEKMEEALANLQTALGRDEDTVKILACMLKASADAYAVYKEKGIPDKVYFDTMKCYTRFIEETYAMTGRLYFDRYRWTTRQAGCHLFRIGELEYEMAPVKSGTVIKLHIPSDADFSPNKIDESLASAKLFFGKHYPELAHAEYHCYSWLLDGQLKDMLRENSNIVLFQNRFEIFDSGEPSTDFIKWLYHTKSADSSSWPEDTSLQRNVKKLLLSGGQIRNAHGRMR